LRKFTEDNGCQVAAIPHMTVTIFIRVVVQTSFAEKKQKQKKKSD
jgi:hypothetical protein